MNKRTIKRILVVILSALVIYCGYWIIDMYQFAKGVKEDTPKFVESVIKSEVQNGDIIFQTSMSRQSKAIQLATNSKYSHMGIIYKIDGKLFVYEAIQPVKLTLLKEWRNRGKDEHFVIKRLKNSDEILTQSTLAKMRQVGEKYNGKNYDQYFEWTDDKIYCSELVWKIFKEGANIEIGKLEELSNFDLSNKIVKQKMKERYGEKVPMDEKVISPAQMFNSDKLEIVLKNH